MQGRDALRLLGSSVCALLALCGASASAQPADGPRETVDQSFTTTSPNSPTGLDFSGAYHAAGDPAGEPPYMRRVVISPPPGMRYDTSVPDRCEAPDVELQAMGPGACPAGSQIGTGTAEGVFYAPVTHSFVVDNFKHDLFVLNSADGQILLVKSEGYTVLHGHLRPDGSMDFAPPTCFPSPPTGCADDYVLQTKTATSIPAYTRGRAQLRHDAADLSAGRLLADDARVLVGRRVDRHRRQPAAVRLTAPYG